MFRKLWCRIRTHHKLQPTTFKALPLSTRQTQYSASCRCGLKTSSYIRNQPKSHIGDGTRKARRQHIRIAKRLGYL